MRSPLLSWQRGLLAAILITSAARASTAELSPKVLDLIDRFFSPVDFDHLQLSPNGTHVLVEKEIHGQKELITVEFKTGKRVTTSSDPGRYVTKAQWVGQNQVLFEVIEDVKEAVNASYATDATFLKKTVISHVYGGHWLMDATLTDIWKVPTLEHIMTVVDHTPQNPNRVFMVEQWTDKFYSPLYCYDPAKNETRILERNPGRVIGWTADPAGQVRLAEVAELHESNSFLYRENEQSPWNPLALPPHSNPVGFDGSGQNLLISHPDEAGRLILQPFDLATKQLAAQKWSDPVYDIDPILIQDPRTGTPQALAYDANREEKLIWLDPRLKALHASLEAAFPSASVFPIGIIDTGDVLLRVESDVSPLQYFVLNRQHRQIGLFLDPTPKLRSLKLSPMQPIAFQASDGATIYGYLTMPPGHANRPAPMIVLSHGGPAIREIWGFDSEVQYLAALGYAVLQVNYRGSTGYGNKYSLETLVAVGHQSVDDVADGIRWAIGKGYADPKRVVALGASYGGYISVALAARQPELICCTIARAGVYDWEFQMKSDSDEFHELFRLKADYYPDVSANAAQYRAISPVYQAAAIRGPVLLVHGRDDGRVKVAQSELMASALKKAGKSVELVRDTEGEHSLRKENLRRDFYEHVTQFLLKYAPPDDLP